METSKFTLKKHYYSPACFKKKEISKYNLGYGYHLSLHKRDAELLKEIKQILNRVGLFYEYENKPDSRLAVNDTTGLLYLIENVFDQYPYKTKNQLVRYLIFFL